MYKYTCTHYTINTNIYTYIYMVRDSVCVGVVYIFAKAYVHIYMYPMYI